MFTRSPSSGLSRRYATAILAGAWLALPGCKPELPSGYDPASAAAFQQRHEEEIGGDASPLATVEAYYLGPRDALGLRFEGDQLRPDDTEDAAVRFVVGEQFRCEFGCSEHNGPIDKPVEVHLGTRRLRVAPQAVADGIGGRVLLTDPNAPALQQHSGLRWFPIEPRLIIAAEFAPAEQAKPATLETSRGLQKAFVVGGHLRFELEGAKVELVAYRSQGASKTAPLLVPFTDRTTGEETYPVGRYLEVHARGTTAAVDFNRATNPWCAYSPHYNCPVPDPANSLPVAVRAGEMTYRGSH